MTRRDRTLPWRRHDISGAVPALPPDAPSPLAVVLRGAASGLTATLPMTAFMYAADRLGWQGRLGPEAIVEQGLDVAGVRRSRRQEVAGITVAHLSFGTACGAGYGLLAGGRRGPGHPALAGIAFGLVVWAVSYQGWVPAAGILPPAGRDRADRQLRLLLAHVVYGATLGWLDAGHTGGSVAVRRTSTTRPSLRRWKPGTARTSASSSSRR